MEFVGKIEITAYNNNNIDSQGRTISWKLAGESFIDSSRPA